MQTAQRLCYHTCRRLRVNGGTEGRQEVLEKADQMDQMVTWLLFDMRYEAEGEMKRDHNVLGFTAVCGQQYDPGE